MQNVFSQGILSESARAAEGSGGDGGSSLVARMNSNKVEGRRGKEKSKKLKAKHRSAPICHRVL